MTLATALAAPVEDGMMLPEAQRPPRQSLFEDASTTFWVAVMAWTVVMRPLDAELVVDGLDHGREAVGRAGRAGDGDHGGVVGLLVDAHDDGRGVVLGGGREDDLLGAGGDVGRDLVAREEGARGLADVLGAHGAEGDLGGVARVRRRREDAVDHEAVGRGLDGARVAAVDGVVLELVGHVLVGGARVHELEVDGVRLGHDAGHEAADAAEAVDAAGDGHGRRLGGGLGARGRREGIARRGERRGAGGEEGGGGVLHFAIGI